MFNKNNFSEFGYEFVNDERIESWQVIVRYLNDLQDRDIVEVLPSLSRVTRSRRVIESFMPSVIDSVFYNCKTGAEVISLADKLIHDISTEKENVFANAAFDYTYWDVDLDLLFAIGYDGTSKKRKKVYRKACEKLYKELIEYLHPYISGVLNRKSILCKLFRKQCQEEGFELKRA